MGVAGEIGKHCFRPGEGRLGVDEPSLPLERCETCGEGLASMQVLDLAKNASRPAAWASASAARNSRRNRRDSTCTGSRKPGLQRAPSASRRARSHRPAQSYEGADGHCRAPAVEHSGGADASAEVFGIGSDREQRFGRRTERHCPKCQGAAAKDWLAAREADLLPVGYFHLVFTLPAEIAPIAYQNKAVVYDLLFRAASETLLTIAADPKHLGARIGFTAVLHSWGSAMTHHPHVHIIVPGGGISLDGT